MLVGTRENVRRHISFVYARFSVTYNLSCAVATTVEHEHLVSHISSTCGRAHALCRAARAGWGCRRAAAAQHSDAPTRRRLGVDGAADVSPSPVLAVARWWGGGYRRSGGAWLHQPAHERSGSRPRQPAGWWRRGSRERWQAQSDGGAKDLMSVCVSV